MASTLSPTTFKIKIIEEQIVRNNVLKNEITHTIENVTNVDRRVVTCPQTTSINLINLSETNPGAGTFPSSSIQYIRITNLDNENDVAVILSGSQGTFTQNLTPSNSYFVASSQITSSNFDGTFGDNIESISLYALNNDIDIEFTIINA
jgi:hypothetical protein